MTGQELLKAALADAHSLARLGAITPRAGKEDHDVALVATALLRRTFVQATAVATLVDAGQSEATTPNVRSLYEAFGDLNYLLSQDSLARARVALIFGRREVRDYLRSQRKREAQRANRHGNTAAQPPAAEPTDTDIELEQWRTRAPKEYELAMAKGLWWTAGTKGELLQDALASVAPSMDFSVGSPLYKMLSLEDHHVLSSLVSVDTIPGSSTFGHVTKWNPSDDADEFVYQMAAVALIGALRRYRKAFPETARSTPNK
jgi:hypothetical protein